MWRWLRDAVDAAADFIEDAFNAAAEAVSDFFDTAASWLRDLAEPPDLDDLPPGEQPPGRGGGFLRWLARGVASVLESVGVVVKAVLNFVGGLVAGVVRILGGILSLSPGLILEGLTDILVAIAGPLILLLGKAVALAQTLIPIERPSRRLDPEERALLRRIYQESLGLFNIRIVENRAGAGVFGASSAPFVLGNTIYMKNTAAADWDLVLVHESLHVWQYQQEGAEYLARAIGNQMRGDGTAEWRAEADAGEAWEEFGWENQAWFIEDVWEEGELVLSDGTVDQGRGAFFDFEDPGTTPQVTVGGSDYTDLAVETTGIVRGRRSWRLSSLFD